MKKTLRTVIVYFTLSLAFIVGGCSGRATTALRTAAISGAATFVRETTLFVLTQTFEQAVEDR